MSEIRTVGVLGNGLMGSGIAQTAAAAGFTTIVREVADAAIEKGKAGMVKSMDKAIEKGKLDAKLGDTMYTTYLASMFRSIRFGINEAHGKGMALQVNTLLDRGAFVVNADGTFSVVDAKIRDAVAGLTRDLMTIQAEGNYDAAKALLAKMAVVRPEVQRVLDRLTDVPVDIESRFTILR